MRCRYLILSRIWMQRRWLVNSQHIQVIKVYIWVGSGRNGCRLISFSKLFAKIFIGLKKLSSLWKNYLSNPEFSLQSYKLEFARLQTPVWTKENSCLGISKLMQTGMCHYAGMMACSLGRVQEILTLLGEAEASAVATDAFTPRRRSSVRISAQFKQAWFCSRFVVGSQLIYKFAYFTICSHCYVEVPGFFLPLNK
jgi:hypothetical protein